MLNSDDCDILPTWSSLQEFKANITPPVSSLPDPYIGVHAKFTDAIKMTVERILLELDIQASESLELDIKWGFDGSGGHAIYNQINNANTHNIVMAMFTPL